jgi:alpha-tubulin suppressor-like RCC1 family protein
VAAVLAFAPAAHAESAASDVRSAEAGRLDLGQLHGCAILTGGVVRCWGEGANGRLGNESAEVIGDNEPPSSIGPVDLGPGRTARALALGNFHSCAVLDNGQARCWGSNDFRQLGRSFGDATDIGDDETPGEAEVVGVDLPVVAITAGRAHTCAILQGGKVGCWGLGTFGRLGYGNTDTIGNDEDPQDAGYVDLGVGRSARAITAGSQHTCAILDDGSVRCWGDGQAGQLGMGSTQDIGDGEAPAAFPVPIGAGRTARAITAGEFFTCAILDDGSVKCWGQGATGEMGRGTTSFGSNAFYGDEAGETPAASPPVDLGPGRTAKAIAASGAPGTVCVVMDNDAVRCWGSAPFGKLGYGSLTFGTNQALGDEAGETPAIAGPVDLGAGRTARAIAMGTATCATLDDGNVLCWGLGNFGQHGGATTDTIGDDETPGSRSPVQLGLGVPVTGDLSVLLTADAASRQVGQEVRLTGTTSSAGPDAARAGRTAVTLSPGLEVVSATPGAGAFAGGTWSLPTLTGGSNASLTVVARVTGTGAQTATLELTGVAEGFSDTDSTPGNRAPAEDDQASVTVTGTPVPPVNLRPVLAALSMARRIFAVGRARTPIRLAGRTPRGSAFRFTLSEVATVTVLVQRRTIGRRVRGRCVARTRRNAQRRRCRRFVRAGLLTRRNMAAGRRRIPFSGRVGRRALRPGSYRATLTPTDTAGVRGSARRITFTIRRR